MDFDTQAYENGECILHLGEWLQDFESASGIEFPLAAHYFARTASKCACGVVESFAPQFFRFFFFAFIQRLIWSFDVQHPSFVVLVDLVIGILGAVLSFQNRNSLEAVATIFIYFIISTAAIFIVREIESTWTGHICAFLTFLYTVCCQLYVFDALTFTSLYGCLMVAAMKQISLAYDSENRKRDDASNPVVFVFDVFAFVFNPATFSFGPFLTFDEFLTARRFSAQFWRKSWHIFFGQLLLTVRLLIVAFIFLVASHCFSEQMPYLIFGPDSTFLNIFPLFPDFAVEFAMGYGEAQSFRFNHYFICYLADGLCAVAGLRYVDAMWHTRNVKHKKTSKTSALWPAVEWPRSMSAVVVAWNLPMHKFLHRYIYQTTRDSFGYFISILFTFGVSAFLHGFNFQLSAVLISLAVYGVVESDLRYRLSYRFNSCVKSRPCHDYCGHRFKTNNMLVKLVNFLFVAQNIFHLAYLGAPFAASAEESEAGYHWRHTLNVWSHWNFSSPVIVLATFFISRFI